MNDIEQGEDALYFKITNVGACVHIELKEDGEVDARSIFPKAVPTEDGGQTITTAYSMLEDHSDDEIKEMLFEKHPGMVELVGREETLFHSPREEEDDS